MCSSECASVHAKLPECGIIEIMGRIRSKVEGEEEVFLYEPILALRLLLLRLLYEFI